MSWTEAFWRGVRWSRNRREDREELLVELPSLAAPTPAAVVHQANQAALEHYLCMERQAHFEVRGPGPWIAEARFRNKLVAKDVNLGLPRELWELKLLWDRLHVLHVINHTLRPGRDGGFDEYWLVVPNTVQTPREAVAHSFGFNADDYKEAVAT